MFKSQRFLAHSKFLFFTTTAVFLGGMQTSLAESSGILIAQADTAAGSQVGTATEEVYVIGIRKSIKDAIDVKRDADQIVDAIQAEDIGKLPDVNVAEAMQRVTGVTILRDEDSSEGSTFQVRGFSLNQVEVNGQPLVSNNRVDRNNSFSTIPAGLFSGIEVIKSPTADMIEGAIGATVRLKTYQPLDFKSPRISGSIERDSNDNALDDGTKMTLLGTTKFDLGNTGQIGVLLNTSYEDIYKSANEYFGVYDGIEGTNGPRNNREDSQLGADHPSDPTLGLRPILSPRIMRAGNKDLNIERLGVDTTVQWEVNDQLEIYLQGRHSDFERERNTQRLNMWTDQSRGVARLQPDGTLGYDLRFRDYNYSAAGRDLFIGDPSDPATVTPYTGQVDNYILTSGLFVATKNAANPANSPLNPQGTYEVVTEKQTGFALGTKFSLNDVMHFQVEFASSEAERIRNKRDVQMDVVYTNPNNTNTLYPSIYYDARQGTDIANYTFPILNPQDITDTAFMPVEWQSGNVGTGNVLTDMGNETFVMNNQLFRNINQQFEFDTTQEDSVKIDLDWDINAGIFTTFETGVRHAVRELDVERWDDVKRRGDTGDGDPTNDRDIVGTGTFRQSAEQIIAASADPAATRAAFQGWLTAFPTGQSTSGSYPRTFFAGPRDNPLAWNRLFDELVPDDPATTDVDESWFVTRSIDADENIEETTDAIYFKVNFETELFGFPATGNFGVRYVETDVVATAYSSADPRALDPTATVVDLSESPLAEENPDTSQINDPFLVTQRTTYDNVLPSANINLAVRDDMYLRMAVSKAMARPDPEDLLPSLDITSNGDAEAGNPNLVPFESTQFDLSWEWYINETNSLTAAIFYKDVKNFLLEKVSSENNDRYNLTLDTCGYDTSGTDPVLLTVFPVGCPVGEIIAAGDQSNPNPENYNTDGIDGIEIETDNIPAGVNATGANGDLIELFVNQPFNGGDGTTKGIEVQWTSTFDMLPGWASGFGTQISATLIDSEQDAGFNRLTGERLPVPELSETAYNVTLFYEKYGFSARLAYSYRDESMSPDQTGDSLEPVLLVVDQGETVRADGVTQYTLLPVLSQRYEAEYEQLDFSMDYELPYNLKIYYQVSNIGDEPLRTEIENRASTRRYIIGESTSRIGLRWKLDID